MEGQRCMASGRSRPYLKSTQLTRPHHLITFQLRFFSLLSPAFLPLYFKARCLITVEAEKKQNKFWLLIIHLGESLR